MIKDLWETFAGAVLGGVIFGLAIFIAMLINAYLEN